jgi:hypothetical protein
MANAADQPDRRIVVPVGGTLQPGAGKIEFTSCPWSGRGAPLPGQVPPALQEVR